MRDGNPYGSRVDVDGNGQLEDRDLHVLYLFTDAG